MKDYRNICVTLPLIVERFTQIMNRLCLLLVLVVFQLQAQNSIPQDYFSSPLDIPIILSGSFGELRSNHFHSGLDIKTQQRRGLPIYAPADGYVSRIKVGHYGYGKALYLKHPNGYSTVYAHLQKYAGAIQKFVKDNQYQKESYQIELFPEPTLLVVKKGEIIGYTGNSGSSGGPHLHYEIRDSASRPMNPMLFGVDVPDTKDPIVNAVFAYPVSEDAMVNQSKDPIKLRLIKLKNGHYKTEKISAFGKVGFGVSTNDQQNGASNKNGVYNIKTAYNGEQKIDIAFKRFSFDETRYLNRYVDYGYYKKNKSRVQKLFRETNNPLSIIKSVTDNGYIDVEDGFTSNYTISITDFKGNLAKVTIPVIGKNDTIIPPRRDNNDLEYVASSKSSTLNKGKFTIYVPKNALYEGTYLDVSTSGDTLHFHEDVVPVHKNISISMDISNYKGMDKSKLYIGRLDYKNRPNYTTTRRKDNVLTARTRTMGSYTLAMDTIPPAIKPHNFIDGKWISKNKTLQVKIEDTHSGISKYRATLNGKFILMEYNYKKDVLTYSFEDEIIQDAENNLKLIVTDNVGNSSTFEATFFRKKR